MLQRCLVWSAVRLATLGAMAGCVDRASILVRAGPEVGDVVFHINASDSDGRRLSRLSDIRVVRKDCAERGTSLESMWLSYAENGVGPSPAPASIGYGIRPEGFVDQVAPRPLIEGCYEVSVGAPKVRGSAEFVIGAGLRLVE